MAFAAPSLRSTWPGQPPPYLSRCPLCRRPISVPSPTSPTMRSKREKRSHLPSSSLPTPASPSPPPLRVDVESSTLSLREQLKQARSAAAAASEQPGRQVSRTRFRQKKRSTFQSGESRRADYAAVPDGKYALEVDPVLYIDAYNVICAWPRLRKHRDRGDLETARRLLLHNVAEFAHVRGWQCVVVFDAHGNDNPGRSDVTPQSVEVVFTGTETADSYIERAVFESCEAGERQVWAATSDVAQLSFSRAKGAHIMSSNLFIQELKRAKRETKEKVGETDEAAARAKMLISNVDEDTRNALYALRDKLNG